MPKSKVYNFSDEEFRAIIAESQSWCDCARKLGMSPYGSNSKIQISKRIEELQCDISHFITKRNGNSHHVYATEEILVENSPYKNIPILKKRLLKEGLLEYKCAICGNTGEWLGQPLTLQLDHINGDHFDHRLENLRLLCPNCHSQTETFSGKNKNIES